MSAFTPQKFTINSALELVADSWTAELPDSGSFRSASIADRVTLKAGFLSGTGTPLTIASILLGVIDEYELVITPINISGRVRGRDPSAAILDSYYQRTYTRASTAVLPNAGYIESLPTVPPSTLLENVTVGDITAKQIAKDAVESVGLILDWAVRDYTIQNTFQASGRVVETLRRLVEPWNLVEPFRVDIYLQGSVVIVRHRQLPGQLLQPDYVLSLVDMRRNQLVVRKRRFKKLGTITLHGQLVPDGLTTAPSGSGGGLVFVATNETHTQYAVQKDTGGNNISTVLITTTLRMPDRIPIQSIKEVTTWTNVIRLSSRETITYDVEDSVYDFSGPVNQPNTRSQSIIQERIDPEDDIFKVMATELTVYTYDANKFLINQTTTKKIFDSDEDALVDDEMTIESLFDVGALLCERIVEQYKFNSDDDIWELRKRDTSLAGGHRPGGPGRGQSTAGLQNGAGGTTTFNNLTATLVLSTDPDAANVEYTNENLTLDDLNFILSLFQGAQGLYEYEFQFDGVSMPWFHRGMSLQIVDLFAEDAVTPITLPPCIVTSVNVTYDESGSSPGFLQQIRAFGIGSS